MPATRRLPDLEALRLFVAVAQSGSIGSAGRAVGLTQQAASQRMITLERTVGVPLLDRGSRGSVLTEAGTALVEWASRLLQSADEVDAAITALRAERDRSLRVSASMTIAEHLLPRWLVALRQRQQAAGVAPTLISLAATNSTAVILAITDGSADLGFVEGAPPPAHLGHRDIADDELVLVASPVDPLTRRRRPLDATAVAALALTSREAGSGTREVVDRALAAHGLVSATPAVELTTSTGIREAVRAGSAPAFLSRRTVDRDLDVGSLVAIPTVGLDLRRTFRAIWIGGRQPPAGPIRDLLAVARANPGSTTDR